MEFNYNNTMIQIPEKLGGWIVQKVIPLDYIDSDYVKNHRRLQVFAIKGIECSVRDCPCKGAFFIERVDTNKKGEPKGVHVDLYTEDFQLMTVDHHIAKSKGGNDTIENKFPMCAHHNTKKGRLDPEVFYSRFGVAKQGNVPDESLLKKYEYSRLK